MKLQILVTRSLKTKNSRKLDLTLGKVITQHKNKHKQTKGAFQNSELAGQTMAGAAFLQ